MNETYIQTIRGGIPARHPPCQRPLDSGAQTVRLQLPSRTLRVHPSLQTVQADPGSSERNMGGIRLALLREPLPDSGADGCTDAGVRKLYKVFHDAVRNL